MPKGQRLATAPDKYVAGMPFGVWINRELRMVALHFGIAKLHFENGLLQLENKMVMLNPIAAVLVWPVTRSKGSLFCI